MRVLDGRWRVETALGEILLAGSDRRAVMELIFV